MIGKIVHVVLGLWPGKIDLCRGKTKTFWSRGCYLFVNGFVLGFVLGFVMETNNGLFATLF